MLKSRYHAWLVPYVEGTLDSERRVLLEKRMSADPKLAAEAETLRRVTSHLRRSAFAETPIAEPVRSVWPRVEGRLRQRGPAPAVSPRLAWGGVVAIAVGLAFAANQPVQAPQDDYSSSHQFAMGSHNAPVPLSALPSMSASPFSALADPWIKPSPVGVSAMSASSEARGKVAPKPGVSPEAGKLPPGSVHVAGRLARTEHPSAIRLASAAPEHGVGFAAQAPRMSASRLSMFAQGPAFRREIGAFASPMETTPDAPRSQTGESVSAAPAVTIRAASHSQTETAVPAAPAALMESHPAVPANPRMASAGGALSTDLFHPAPDGSRDAIGVAGVNRFFLSLPAGARVSSRPLTSLAAAPPSKTLTSAQSVELLRAEARREQGRGQLAGALDIWRDAVFVSLTSPTYADEQSSAQATQTLTLVNDAGQLTDLRARLERQEEFAPDDIVSLRALGYLYTLTGDVEQARAVWRQVTQSDMAIGEDWYQLAGAELINGDTAAARAAYGNAVYYPGGLPAASVHRAVALRWLADTSH